MTQEHPEACPVCGHPYEKHEQAQHHSITLDAPAYSRKCVQRYGTKLNVYYHEKIPIELEGAP